MTKSEAMKITERARQTLRKRRKKIFPDCLEWQEISETMSELERLVTAINVGLYENEGPARA